METLTRAPNKMLDRMERSAVSRMFQIGHLWRAPRHRSAFSFGIKRMKTRKRKRLVIALISKGVSLLCYIGGYLHFVRPMPVRVGPSNRESVEPVFRTVRHSIIRLLGPAVAVDQAFFPSRWDLQRFRLPPHGFGRFAQDVVLSRTGRERWPDDAAQYRSFHSAHESSIRERPFPSD
jgi:hypothetical protein